MLRFIAEQLAVPLDQLADFLGVYVCDARRVVADFEGLGWVSVRQFVVGDTSWVWLRKGGAAASGTGFAARPPALESLFHRRAVNEVRLMLESRVPEGRWVCERQLHRERLRRHKRWIDDDRTHVADGVFEVNGERHAIEVELSRKTEDEMRSILASHSSRYDAIVYFCTPQTRRHLERMDWALANPKLVIRGIEIEGRRLHAERWRVGGEDQPLQSHEVEVWEQVVLDLLGEQGAVPLDQLARFLKCGEEKVERMVRYLSERGLIKRARPLVDDADWVWLTGSGVRSSTKRLSVTHPGLGGLKDWRAANEVRLHLAERAPEARWTSRRELWRGATSTRAVPWGVLEVNGERHAVEVFLKARRLERVVELLTQRSEEYDAVICFGGAAACRSLRRMLKKGVWPKVVVRCIPELAPAGVTQPQAEELWELEAVTAEELPGAVLSAIAKAAETPSVPRILEVGKRVGPGPHGFEVETVRGRFKVTDAPRSGWRARKTPGRLGKSTKDHPHRRDRLVTAMIDAVADVGYDKLSVQKVLMRKGLSRATFYEEFKDKEGCFLAVVDVLARRMWERIEAAVAGAPSGWQRGFRAGLAELLRFVAEEPKEARVLLVEARASTPAGAQCRDELFERFVVAVDALVRRDLDEPPSGVVAAGIVGGIESVVIPRLQKGEIDDLDELVSPLMNLALLSYAN